MSQNALLVSLSSDGDMLRPVTPPHGRPPIMAEVQQSRKRLKLNEFFHAGGCKHRSKYTVCLSFRIMIESRLLHWEPKLSKWCVYIYRNYMGSQL